MDTIFRPTLRPGGTINHPLEEYWDYVAAVLFIQIPVDMLTTTFALKKVGVEHEGNPLMRWIITQGVAEMVIINVLVVIVAIVMFHGLHRMLIATPQSYQRPFANIIEAWFVFLILAGFFVFLNNMTLIFLGETIITVAPV